MDNLSEKFQLMIDERDSLVVQQQRWQAKWDNLMSLNVELDQKKTEITNLTKEQDVIVSRVSDLMQRQRQFHADLQQKLFVLNSPVASKEIQ